VEKIEILWFNGTFGEK